MPIRSAVIITILALTTFLSGCREDSQETKLLPILQSSDFAVEKSSWLRDHLPAETVVYISVPNLWNYLFDPKGDSLHQLQTNPIFQKQITAIKQAAEDNYLGLVPANNQLLLKALLNKQTGPIEIATINYVAGGLMPNVAIGTHFSDFSEAQMIELVNQVLNDYAPGISPELSRQDDKQLWRFDFQNMPNWIQYQEKTGQFLMLSGPGASNEKLNQLWNKPADPALNDVLDLDKRLDPSGLNLRMWMAPATLYQLGAGFVPPEQRQKLEPLAIDKTQYIWLGTSSNAGKSSLAIHYLIPETGWRMFLPRSEHSFDITTAGAPKSVMQIALPTRQQWQTAVNQPMISHDAKSELQEISNNLKDVLGFEPSEMLDAYEQQVYLVNDDAGRWMALKIKDSALHNTLSQQLLGVLDEQPQQNKLAGVTIHHMHFSSIEKLYLSAGKANSNTTDIERYLGLLKEHHYWMQKDDVIYMAKVPQILAELANTDEPTQLSQWLANQGLDWHNSILAYGTEIDDMPRDIYYFYLTFMQTLADLAGTEIDLFALPTAQELKLPPKGRLSLSAHSDRQGFSVEIDYEYSLAEHLIRPETGMLTVAVAGILAAYAIPAYRDYTMRAKIMQSMSYTSVIKMTVAEHYIDSGNFQGATELLPDLPANISLEDATGVITIHLDAIDDSFSDEDYVQLFPEVTESGIAWHCESTVRAKLLPAFCR